MEEYNPGQELNILVVDDDTASLALLCEILENAGFKVKTAHHGKGAQKIIQQERPALILADISIPDLISVIREAVRRQLGGTAIPIVFLTTPGPGYDISTAQPSGADDFITKPFRSHEVLTTVRDRLSQTNDQIMELDPLLEAYKNTIYEWEKTLETQDQSTNWSTQMNAYAQKIANELGWEFGKCEILKYAVTLHDIGKIGIPDKILNKPGPLTKKEWKVMKEHPVIGAQIVAPVKKLALVAPIIRSHHENWDGSGYPNGLKGEEIPEEARLLAVVNTFNNMTTDVPYRPALALNDAFKELINNSGTQFDPKMVEAFRRCWERGEIQVILKGRENMI